MKLAAVVRISILIAVVLLLTIGVQAQTSATGGLTGTVKDPSGATVPSVTVTAINAGTGQTRTVTTGDDGAFRFSLLSPGTYIIKFEATGFRPAEIRDINVIVTETPVVNAKLEVGVQSQEVQVEANAEVVQTTSATVGTVVAGATMTEMPLSTRNFTNLLGLSAGANADVNNATALGKGSQYIQVNGGSYLNNTYSMDGSVVNNFISNGTTEVGTNASFGVPNPDAIEEFKIQTSNYDASFGRNSGANVNVVTKSGSNSIHGTVFEFFRNSVLDANDWFNKYSQGQLGVPNKQQVLNQNQFGFSFGGPIKKGKLFFFTSYQQTNQKNGASGYGYSQGVNLPALPSGDRSTASWQQALGAIYCNIPTYTQIVGLGGVQVACDGSNLNPVALAVLNLKLPNGEYYIPAAPASGTPVSFSIPAIYHEYQGIGNFDYVVTPKNTVSGRYFFATDPTNAPFPGNGLGFPSPDVPGNPVFMEYGNQSASLKLSSVITPNFLNEAKFAYQRTTVTNQNQIPFTDTQVGMQPVIPTVDYLSNMWFLPIFGSTAMDPGAHPFFGQGEGTNQYTLSDAISWTRGKHTLRIGFEIEKDQWNWSMPSISTGAVIFGDFSDFLVGLGSCPAGTWPVTCNTGNPGSSNGTPVSNILSIPNFVSAQTGSGVRHNYRASAYNWFVQDDIKVSSRLTLNAGLRWEYFPSMWDKAGQDTNLAPDIIAAAGIPGDSPANGSFVGYVVPGNYVGPALPDGVIKNSGNSFLKPMPKDNFAPRLGFSFMPFRNFDRFVLRGGGGFFYDRIPGSSYIWSTNQNIPYAYAVPYLSSASEADPWGPINLGWNAPRWVNFTDVTSSNISINLMPSRMLTPVVYTWNLNMQYEFLPTWLLEVGYVGSRGVHSLLFNLDFNNIGLLASPTNPINGITDNTQANAALRAPFLGIAPWDTATDNRGDSHYHGLQTALRKRVSHGLSLQVNYTWSKTLSTGGSDNDHPELINFDTGKLIYQQEYRPQRLTFFYSYDFPIKDGSGYKAKALGGWNLSGSSVIQSGTPLTINDSQGGTVYFGQTSSLARPDFCPNMGPGDVAAGGSMYNRVTSGLTGGNGYFKSGVFCGVPSYGYGNTGSGDAGASIIRGPGQNNWDVSFSKTTRVGGINETASLLFRAEFFNAFNHPMFKTPNVDSSSPTFGQITGTAVNPRILQFALKYVF